MIRIALVFVFMSGVVFRNNAQDIPQIKIKDLEKMMSLNEPVQVINFWATWCAPCIKELPQFEKLHAENKSVSVTLVSLDFELDPDPGKVARFVTRKKLQSKVVILAEKDPNSWIDKIDKEWGGSLPATLIISGKTGKRKFIEKELKEGELDAIIQEMTK